MLKIGINVEISPEVIAQVLDSRKSDAESIRQATLKGFMAAMGLAEYEAGFRKRHSGKSADSKPKEDGKAAEGSPWESNLKDTAGQGDINLTEGMQFSADGKNDWHDKPTPDDCYVRYLTESGWGEPILLKIDTSEIQKEAPDSHKDSGSGIFSPEVAKPLQESVEKDDNRWELIQEAYETLDHKLPAGPGGLIVALKDLGWSIDKIAALLGVKQDAVENVFKGHLGMVIENGFNFYCNAVGQPRKKAEKPSVASKVPKQPKALKKQSKAVIRNRKKKTEETPEKPQKPTKCEEIRAAINPAEYKDIPSLIAGIQENTGLTKKAIAEAIGLAPSDLSNMISGRQFYPYMQDALRRIGWPAQEPGEEYKSEIHARQALEKGEGK